jgi:hypothetical protein
MRKLDQALNSLYSKSAKERKSGAEQLSQLTASKLQAITRAGM